MGGNPFQSLGCKTCKRRRIKCDEQKPKCARCIKRGLVCPGYESPKSFVVFTPNKPYKTLASMRNSGDQNQPVLPCPVPSGPALRVQLYSSFLDSYFPVSVDDAWYSVVTGWPRQPASTDLFQRSLTAWACVSLGKTKNDRAMLQQGIRLYSQAIPLMSSMIRRDPYQDDVIYSLMIWTELESHYFSDGSNALTAHWSALKALIKENQRRSPSPTNEPMRLIFDPFQKIITILAIMTDGISTDQYEDIMSSHAISPLDELLRLVGSSSMLFNVLEITKSCDQASCKSLLAKCVALRQSTLAWYSRRQIDIDPTLPSGTDKEPHGPWQTCLGDLCVQEFQFSSLESARLHVMFFNTMRLLHALMARAKALISSNIASDVFEEDNHLLECFYADQIAQSIPFCLQERNRACLAHFSILLLGQISQTYIEKQMSDRLIWCQDMLTTISNLGFSSARHRKVMMLERWTGASSKERH